MKSFRQSPPRPKKSTLVIGPKAVLEALESGQHLDKVYLDLKSFGPVVHQIRQAAGHRGVPIQMVPIAKLNSFHIDELSIYYKINR